ncbi:MAG TPA: hypothetical protein VNA22_05720 [Pyrinomonadaceae bacterium]|nr:hypothetical protein [Pyrinomonadaceae bacterium]
MLRIILGIIVGFVVWTVLWLGSDQALISFSPQWYGVHQHTFEAALMMGSPFTPDTTILFMHLFRAVIITIMAGFLAAVVAGENRKTPVFLGVLLLVAGIAVEAMAWSYLPIWYHLIFLALLIPMSILGGKMKQTA